MIRVGLVGAGPWADLFHAPMLADAAGLALGPIWARRRDAAEDLAGRYGTDVADTYDDLLARCDAVAYCVPPAVQAVLAPAAARAGRHLLLEKPLGVTVADAEAIAAAVDAAGVATQLMLTYRFTVQVRDFLGSLNGTPVRHVRTTWIGGGALAGSPFATPWRQDPGAVLLDLGPHALDLAEAAAGPVTEVRAARSGGIVTITTAHAGGAVGHVALSGTTPGAGGPLEAVVVTDAGRYVLADPTPDPPDDVRRTIADEFAGAVHGDLIQSIDVHRGVHVQRLLAAVADAIATGRAVPVTALR
jgi:predicted dehydrogenase